MKNTYILFFIIFSLSLSAQQADSIHINPAETTPIVLSQIADEVIPIALVYNQSDRVGLGPFYLTDEYLFAVSGTNLYQYDLSGKLIKSITCNIIKGITGNPVQKEIYISTSRKNEIICFDYSLETKKTYKIQNPLNSIFFYDNYIWGQATVYQDNIPYHKIFYLDPLQDKENYLTFEFIDNSSFNGFRFDSQASFFIYKDQLSFAFTKDSVIYQINNNKAEALYCINIESRDSYVHYKAFPFSRKGAWGKYLYLDYAMQDLTNEWTKARLDRYFYMKDMKTGQIYHTREKVNDRGEIKGFIYDDLYHTGQLIGHSFNQDGYFYFLKTKAEVEEMTSKIETKEGPVLFIVKTKE